MNVAASGAKISLGVNLFLPDADADFHAANLTVTSSTAATVAGKVRLKDAGGTKIANTQYPATAGQDCNDSYSSVYPANDNWYSASAPTGLNGMQGDYNCNGNQEHSFIPYYTDYTPTPYSSARFNSIICSYPGGKYYRLSDYSSAGMCHIRVMISYDVVDTGTFFSSSNGTACDGVLLFTSSAEGIAIGCH
jgi:hypothetical protein